MKFLKSLCFILGSFLLFGCKDEVSKRWLPLETGNKWIYKQSSIQSKIPSITEPQRVLAESKIEFEITGMLEISQKQYFKYESKDGYRKKMIRYENGNYYSNDSITSEMPDRELLFLKDNLSLGDNWEYLTKEQNYKIAFTVTKLEKSISINGTTYQDTIEITRYYMPKIDGNFKKNQSSRHIYARGIGEIYSYIPYPLGGIYADDELQLEKFIPATK